MSAWPAIVWSALALRDLDARARGEIAAAGALRRIPARQAAYRDGELAESFFAVVEGVVEVRGGEDATARVLREARAGETFGEEAFVGASVLRRGDAVAVGAATVAAIPGALLRRVLARGASRSAERVERAMRRAAARERLRSSRLARGHGCSNEELDLLLDALDHVHLERGEALFRAGDSGDRAFVVASGLVRLLRTDEHAPAHLGAGEIFGEEDMLAGRRRTYAAVAVGPSWLLAIPAGALREVAMRAPRAFVAAGAWREARFAAGARVAEGSGARSVLGDLHRFAVARSLVLIDEASCVQCGHCSWSCASAHADGVSRLLRRGDVVRARADEADAVRASLVATSCHHCESAACMPVCPTGAIAHGPRGEVVLRAELCTGCGACAKACPWEAIRMAPRGGGGSVAVKCDLCAGQTGGPACVDACPTGALVRVEPRAAMSDVRAALGADPRPPLAPLRPRAAWPFLALGIALAGVAWNGPASRLGSGAVAGAAFALLAAHGVWKRIARRSGRAAYVAHLTTAPLAFAAMAHHVGARAVSADVGGGLVVAAWIALASGLAGAAAYHAVPPLLARIAERGALPEDLTARAKELAARGFAELTGKSERGKAIFAHLIRPYASARWGALALVARGGSVGSEAERLRARIERVLAGRAIPAAEIEPLVLAAVEARATMAERWLQAALRGWLPVHVLAAGVATVLLVAHVILVLVFR